MVDEYARQLQVAQPQGPYYLGGWSLGGNLALQVAAVLEEQGAEVAFVGCIDAPPPLRVTAFWEREKSLSPIAEPAAISDTLVDRRVALLAVMFPDAAQAIAHAWRDVEHGGATAAQQWAMFCEWADAFLGETFTSLRSELQQGGELDVSWALKLALDERLKEADYVSIAAPVSCWWAAQSKSEVDRHIIGTALEAGIGHGVEASVVIDTTHDKIVHNPEFIASFVSAVKRVIRK